MCDYIKCYQNNEFDYDQPRKEQIKENKCKKIRNNAKDYLKDRQSTAFVYQAKRMLTYEKNISNNDKNRKIH